MALFQSELKIPATLVGKFGWPPFSVLDSTTSDWRKRRAEWINIIGHSTEGRELGSSANATPSNLYSTADQTLAAQNVSEFDPLLAELMIKWFSLPGDLIYDPFAGGVVRGAVSAISGRCYVGADVSEKQVKANIARWDEIKAKYNNISGTPLWEVYDSTTGAYTAADMVFTCPPYFNLERYSNDPADLSTIDDYDTFLAKYSQALSYAAKCLIPGGFFVIVVSEVRRESRNIAKSDYVGLVPDTINILRQNSLLYYNNMILRNSLGSLPIRGPQYFESRRKVGRCHQDVLVFYKGDLLDIEKKFGGKN